MTFTTDSSWGFYHSRVTDGFGGLDAGSLLRSGGGLLWSARLPLQSRYWPGGLLEFSLRQASISKFLGSGLVLYLVADVASVSGGLSNVGWVVACAAVVASFATTLRMPAVQLGAVDPERGGRRTAYLGVGLGLALVRHVDPLPMLLVADLASFTGACLASTLLLDLALSAPDPLPVAGLTWMRRLVVIAGLAIWALGLLALLPVPQLGVGGGSLLIPPIARSLALWSLAGTAFVALCLRWLRGLLGSEPKALADNAWPLLGLFLATPGFAVVALAAGFGGPLSSDQASLVLAAAAAGLALSHGRMVDVRQRLLAGGATRRAVLTALSMGLSFAVGGYLFVNLPGTYGAGGVMALASIALFFLFQKALRDPLESGLAPFRGRLLAGLREATTAVHGHRRLEDLAAQVLVSMRGAAGDREASPRIFVLEPDREVRIDAAGQAHVELRSMNDALLSALRADPGKICVRRDLEVQRVKQPSLRPLIDGLMELDALCVVPLLLDRELEGALVVPRGIRRSVLTLEELNGLRSFAGKLATPLSMLAAEARAQARGHQALRDAEHLQDRCEVLEEELERLRLDAVALRAGKLAQHMRDRPVAYSEAMRTLMRKLVAAAAGDAPLLLQAEGGSPLSAAGYLVHENSGRAGEAFVVCDCASLSAERAMAELFGDMNSSNAPGLLRLAAGGTLLMLDLPALPLDVQAALSEALATRQGWPVGEAGEPYSISVRVVGSSRVDLTEDSDCVDPGLAQRFAPLTLAVPPLREREADMESLLLLAIARACRIHGKSVVGIDPSAQKVLSEYKWPGNQGELQFVVHRAVAKCTGSRITPADLPNLPLAPGQSVQGEAQWVGTFEEIEKAAMEQALVRSSGNKSEAARLLALKRSTFVDKLKRHGLDGS